MKRSKWRRILSGLLAASVWAASLALPPDRVRAEEPRENVARGKPVTVAPGMPEDGIGRVTDGAVARGWDQSYMYHTANETEDVDTKAYITIDLGESYEIGRIVYYGVWPPDDGYYNTSHNMISRCRRIRTLQTGPQKLYITPMQMIFSVWEPEWTEAASIRSRKIARRAYRLILKPNRPVMSVTISMGPPRTGRGRIPGPMR